jgi:L-alanine-DL-glutamate epimerase-like enolase superfamily enzyme
LLGNVTRDVISYQDVRRLGGRVAVSERPGLGLEEDAESIVRYTERSDTVS